MSIGAQVHLPVSHRRVISAGAHAAFCIQDLKMILAAKSCLCPGLPTLLANLFRSFSIRDHPRLEDAPSWMREYVKGPRQLGPCQCAWEQGGTGVGWAGAEALRAVTCTTGPATPAPPPVALACSSPAQPNGIYSGQ